MALDFPASPSVGQSFSGPNSTTWKWDGTKWVAGAVSGGSSISISAGSGITVTPSPITGIGSVSLTVPVVPASGGTGLVTYAQGDLLYGSAANVLSALPKNTTATRYLSNTGATNNPAWAQINLPDGVTGLLPIANGSTGQTAWAQGDLLYASAANILSKLAKDTNATRYLSNTGATNNPAWSQIDLTNGVTGILPIANGGTGVNIGSGALWVEVAGDTMTGDLTVSKASPIINVNKPASGQNAAIAGQTNGAYRWSMNLGDNAAESANAGSNFTIGRFNDAGTYIDAPISIRRDTGDISLIHQITVNSAWPTYNLNKPASGTGCQLIGLTNGLNRWNIYLGDNAAESGSNAGSDFVINRFNDAGAYLGRALWIGRATGNVNIAGQLDLNPTAYIWLTNPQRAWSVFNDNTNGNFFIYDNTANKSRIRILPTGPVLTGSDNFSPSAMGNAALQASGSYGGGIMCVDGGVCVGFNANNFGGQMEFRLGTTTGDMTAYFTTGNTFNKTGVWNTISDATVKEQIVPYTRGLADLVQLQPVSFVYNDDSPFADDAKTRRIGLVAQEVEPHVPEIVSESEVMIRDKAVPKLTLQPSNLIYAVLNSLREIDQRLRSLEGA